MSTLLLLFCVAGFFVLGLAAIFFDRRTGTFVVYGGCFVVALTGLSIGARVLFGFLPPSEFVLPIGIPCWARILPSIPLRRFSSS